MLVAVFVAANVCIPLSVGELFPFSYAPMFADAPQCFCAYTIYAPDGARLPEEQFGVHRVYWGNPIGVGVGFRQPPTIDQFGEVAAEATVTAQVAARLGAWPYVDVEQQVIGPVDAQRVGVVQTRRWRVQQP
jgi:hypothetical protein